MRAGKLRARIKIQDKQTIKDPITKINTVKPVTVYECWAEIQQPIGRKFYEAAVAHLESSVFFNIRYKDGIKPGMLVVYGDKTYEIEQVRQDLQYKSFTSLQCKEVM
jgi:SPP1 family predicted phage head-tail adaptor